MLSQNGAELISLSEIWSHSTKNEAQRKGTKNSFSLRFIFCGKCNYYFDQRAF